MKVGKVRTVFFRSTVAMVTFVTLLGCERSRSSLDDRDKPGIEAGVKVTQYEYLEDLTRLIGMRRGDWLLLGRLDARGNLVPLPDVPPTKAGGYSGPGFDLINCVRNGKETEPVYEFRSGSLVKGKLDQDYNFVPEAGSTILAFKDYRYSKDALRIYNLPGRFVEKTDPKKQ